MRGVRNRQRFVLQDPGEQQDAPVGGISTVPHDVIGIPVHQTPQCVGAPSDP